jgi:hypothetical protein
MCTFYSLCNVSLTKIHNCSMENFISGTSSSLSLIVRSTKLTTPSGYPGCEFQIREELAKVIGKDKSELFFDKASDSIGHPPIIF